MNRDTLFACATAPKRNSRHWRNTTVTWGQILDWMAVPDTVKEAGNYLLGTLNPTPVTHNSDDGECRRLHRNKAAVNRRSALTLDLDTPEPGMPEVLELTLGSAYVLHTTYSHTTTDPHYRLIIPLDREVTPEEYVVAARAVMQMLGPDNFDPSTDQPERYMFKPAAAEPATFQAWIGEGGPANADDLLADFNPDLSAKPMPKPGKNRRDPYTLDGIIGAFNRAYEDWQVLIEEYELPYQPAGDDRWHLVGAASVAGMGAVSGTGFVYSHHVTDPAYGEVRSAFDLVRVHRFGYLDADSAPGTPINRLPSYMAMSDVATQDARAIGELVGADFVDEQGQIIESEAWKIGVARSRTGAMRDIVESWELLRHHHPVLQQVRLNEMTYAEEAAEDLPWRSIEHEPELNSNDISQFMFYVEATYGGGFRPTKGVAEAVLIGAARNNRHHPVEAYLSSLKWDGIPRLEESLPCDATPYTRMVARKCLVAAVARVFEPGVKWDHTLILHGKEGLGKTLWVDKMSRDWTAHIENIGAKDTLLNLHSSWIATSDEGGSMRKADAEAVKEFLTRRVDVWRAPYDRSAVRHKRRCVIWGTTNDDVFLRKQEGNRRFLIVQVVDRSRIDRVFDEDYVDQVWAEAVHLYRQGEVLLWLDPQEEQVAATERASFVEEGDAVTGLVHRYVNTLLPEEWWSWDVSRRQDWMRNRELLQSNGTMRLDEVCALQVWSEGVSHHDGTKHQRTDLLTINRALRELGWIPSESKTDFAGYGPHRVWHRPHAAELDALL